MPVKIIQSGVQELTGSMILVSPAIGIVKMNRQAALTGVLILELTVSLLERLAANAENH